MTLIRFISADGDEAQEVLAPAGSRLLDIAQNAGQPLEGTCEGQMACSTCHVVIAAEDFAKLPRASEEEEDMLAARPPHAPRRSRLACQIWLTEEMQTLTVHIPSGFHNMQGR